MKKVKIKNGMHSGYALIRRSPSDPSDYLNQLLSVGKSNFVGLIINHIYNNFLALGNEIEMLKPMNIKLINKFKFLINF